MIMAPERRDKNPLMNGEPVDWQMTGGGGAGNWGRGFSLPSVNRAPTELAMMRRDLRFNRSTGTAQTTPGGGLSNWSPSTQSTPVQTPAAPAPTSPAAQPKPKNVFELMRMAFDNQRRTEYTNWLNKNGNNNNIWTEAKRRKYQSWLNANPAPTSPSPSPSIGNVGGGEGGSNGISFPAGGQ